MYDAEIVFDIVNHPGFKALIQSIGQYEIGMKPPNYLDVRVLLLQKKKCEKVNNSIKKHREEWVKYGCSIRLQQIFL